MAVVHGVGSFSIPQVSSTAISPSVTWSDAGTHTPQALLFFWHNGSGTTTSHQFLGMGMTDGTTHYATGTGREDGVVASNTGHHRTDNAPILETSNFDGNLTGQVDFTSFGSNTFTVTPSDQFLDNVTCYYVAFAGYTNVKVLVQQVATATGNFSRTGAGFQPTCGIWMGGGFGATIDAGATNAFTNIGWATGAAAQACVATRIRDASTINYTLGMVNTASIMIRPGTVGAAPEDDLRLVSFDADGFTINHVTSTSTAYYYGALCLKGGAPLATTAVAQTGTGTWNISAAGVVPTLVMGLANWTGIASQTTSIEGANTTYGAHTAGAQWSLNTHSFNNETLNPNVTEEYSHSATDKFMGHFDRAGADSFTATGIITKSAFASEQVTLNQTDADTTAGLIPLLILGEVAVESYLPIFGRARRRRLTPLLGR